MSQTFSDWELILVDDGSTDNSGDICDYYAKSDNRVLVIHKDNGGQSSARNEGIVKSTGKYIAFIDSDDYLADRDSFSSNIRILESNPNISFVKFPVKKEITERGAERSTEDQKREIIIDSREEIFRLWLTPPSKIITNYVYDKIFKRELFANLEFPLKQIFEDRFVFSQIIMNSSAVCISGHGLYVYRNNSASTTHQKPSPYFYKCQILADLNTLRNIPDDLHELIAYTYWNILCDYIRLRKISNEKITIPQNRIRHYIFSKIPIGIKLNILLTKLIGIEIYVTIKG